jgi:hypothetical protein
LGLQTYRDGARIGYQRDRQGDSDLFGRNPAALFDWVFGFLVARELGRVSGGEPPVVEAA